MIIPKKPTHPERQKDAQAVGLKSMFSIPRGYFHFSASFEKTCC